MATTTKRETLSKMTRAQLADLMAEWIVRKHPAIYAFHREDALAFVAYSWPTKKAMILRVMNGLD